MFFSVLLRGGQPRGLRLVRREHLSEEWQRVHDFVLQHIRKHGGLPHPETVELSLRTQLPAAPEGIDYYASRIRENALRLAMEDGFSAHVVAPLTEGKATESLEGAQRVVSEARRDFRPESGSTTLDYHTNTNIRWADYELRSRSLNAQGYPSRFDAITRSTGGKLPGDLWVYAARPNQGKTWLEIVEAMHDYQHGLRVLFASMETPAQGRLPRDQRHRVVGGTCVRCSLAGVARDSACMGATINRQRLSIRFDAVGAGVSAWRLLRGCLTPQEKERFAYYLNVANNPQAHGYGWGQLRIVAPPDVRSLSDLELEVMDFQPDIVYWDSAYLGADLKGAGRKRKDAYDDLLIGFGEMLDLYGIPGVISWHFKREVTKKATSADLGDTAYTDELGRLTDVVARLFRAPEMEDADEALLRTLKVRDGIRMPELRVRWDVKNQMCFSEIAVAEDGMADRRG